MSYDQDQAARARFYALLGRTPPPPQQHPRLKMWAEMTHDPTAQRIAEIEAGLVNPPSAAKAPPSPGPVDDSYWDDCTPPRIK